MLKTEETVLFVGLAFEFLKTSSAVGAGNAAALPRKNFEQIWAKVIKVWANLVRFGQNLAIPKNIRPPTAMKASSKN